MALLNFKRVSNDLYLRKHLVYLSANKQFPLSCGDYPFLSAYLFNGFIDEFYNMKFIKGNLCLREAKKLVTNLYRL